MSIKFFLKCIGVFLAIMCLIFLFPIILNFIFLFFENRKWTIQIFPAIESKEWLSFWGSYAGGIATLIAFLGMWYQNKKTLEINRKSLEFTRLETQVQIEKEKLEKIKEVLAVAIKSFDIHACNTLLNLRFEISGVEQKKIFLNAYENFIKSKTDMEIYTEIGYSFPDSENCEDNENCIPYNLRKKYYSMMKDYIEIIKTFQKFIENYILNKNQESILNNLKQQKEILKSQGITVESTKLDQQIEETISLIKRPEELFKILEEKVELINQIENIDKPMLTGLAISYIYEKERWIQDILSGKKQIDEKLSFICKKFTKPNEEKKK